MLGLSEGSAIKIIKSRSRSLMKNDLLNAFMQISINGPPLHSKEESSLISRVSEQYALARHIKVPIFFVRLHKLKSLSMLTYHIKSFRTAIFEF